MTIITIISALSATALAVVAVASFRRRTFRRQQNAMADAALAAVYGRYQKEAREYTDSYLLHAPLDHQWLAEIEDLAPVWDEPEASRQKVLLRRPVLYSALNVLALVIIATAITGLLAVAIIHRGAWGGLLIPAWGLLGILTQYKWCTSHWPKLLTGSGPVQAVITSVILGLVAAAVFQRGAWWMLIIPACGIIVAVTMDAQRPRYWPALLTGRKPVQAAMGSGIAGLVAASILSGGAWWGLLIPACALLIALTVHGDWPRNSLIDLPRRRPTQAAMGSGIAGLVAASILCGGAWWGLLAPACGLALVLVCYPRHSATLPDRHDQKARDNLVRSNQ
jgi:hypothetical protein